MNQEQTWHDFLALPPIAQQEVSHFIAFLRTRYLSDSTQSTTMLPDLEHEPFIGMWRDHSDMADSHVWVRQLRTNERQLSCYLNIG